MKITSEILPASQIRYNVEIAGDYSRTIYEQILKDMVRNVRVPGFRPGKAPKQLVINHVGSNSIKASVVERIIQDVFKKIFDQKEETRELIGNPTLEPRVEELMDNLEIGTPITMAVTIDFAPEVTLGDYKNISVKAGKVEPDPDYVDKTLHEYRLRFSTLVPVEDRAVQAEDVVTLESEAIDLADGTIVEELTVKETQVALTSNLLEIELFSMVLGMNIGETKEQELVLPQDFPIEALQGKAVRVKHHVIDIKARDLPPLDDEFARTISKKQTLEELKEFLRGQAVELAEAATNKNIEDALLFALEGITTVDLPNSLIEPEVRQMVRQEVSSSLKSMGLSEEKIDTEQLLNSELGKQLRDMFMENAVSNVKQSVALLKLAELENLEVPPDRYQAALAEARETLKGKSYDEERLAGVVKESLTKELAINWLKENATIELVAELDPDREESPGTEDLVHNTDS